MNNPLYFNKKTGNLVEIACFKYYFVLCLLVVN